MQLIFMHAQSKLNAQLREENMFAMRIKDLAFRRRTGKQSICGDRKRVIATSVESGRKIWRNRHHSSGLLKKDSSTRLAKPAACAAGQHFDLAGHFQCQ